MLKYDETVEISDIFFNILDRNPQFRILKGNIFNSKYGLYVNGLRVIQKIKLKNGSSGSTYNYISKNNNIHIIHFNNQTLKDVLYRIRNEYGYTKRSFYETEFDMNELFNDVKNVKINLNTDLKFSKEMYNYHLYKSYMRDNDSNQYFFIGENNYLFAIRCSGSLVINESILKILLSKFNNNVEDILEKLLFIFCEYIRRVDDIDILTLKNTLTRMAFDDLFKVSISKKASGDLKKLYKSLLNRLTTYVDKKISKSHFGIKDQYSYKTILNTILEEYKDREVSASHRGFRQGICIGLKLEMLGWTQTRDKFIGTSSSCIWWYKDVNIIPEIFIYRGIKYLIPIDYRTFKVTKLYVSSEGRLRCIGKHPNVSGGVVCMGDLKIDFNLKESELEVILKNAEVLLDIINFDSAYSYESLPVLRNVSKQIEMYNQKVTNKDIKQIKKVSFLSEDDIEESDEDDKKEEGKVVKDTEKYKIIRTSEYSSTHTEKEEEWKTDDENINNIDLNNITIVSDAGQMITQFTPSQNVDNEIIITADYFM